MRLGRSADAAHAYSESIRLNGESVPRLMGFAEASLLAGKGIVGDEVRRASSRILALEPGRAEPRAWLALGKEQDGDLAGAAADYKAMLEEAGADAPWRQPVEERLEAVAQRLAGTAAPLAGTADGAASKDAPKDARGTPGGAPGGRDAAAIAGLPAGEQARMIEGMVTRLAERLRENGKDIGGWQRLIRSYAVLGRKDEAKAAIADARKNFSDDEGVQVKLDELARSLGLGS
jgi:cytochrome c-type biogenesis protein CcmH